MSYVVDGLMFVVKNKDLFKINLDVLTFNARSNCDFHFPMVNLTVCQKGVQCSGIKLYNHLPSTLKQISYDIHKFKVALKKFPDHQLFLHCGGILLFINRKCCSPITVVADFMTVIFLTILIVRCQFYRLSVVILYALCWLVSMLLKPCIVWDLFHIQGL
jgi:hypothetical protein